MKNRSRTEIITSILQVINRGGAKRTIILYRSFISYSQLNEYVAFLLGNDLISLQQKTKRISSSFMITEKGAHFLEIYNRINELITIP
jgi:predicted transcriptional regulator